MFIFHYPLEKKIVKQFGKNAKIFEKNLLLEKMECGAQMNLGHIKQKEK